MNENYLIELLISFLRKENLAFNSKDIKLQLLSNPDYPSFLSITDTLDYFDIPTIAAKVPQDYLKELPRHFIAFTNHESGPEISLVTKNKQTVHVTNSKVKNKELKVDVFKALWDGTILILDRDGEPVKSKNKNFKSPNALLLIVSLIGLGTTVQFTNWSTIFLLIIALFGLVTSYLAVIENIGIKNKIVSKVCNSNANASGECSQVIGSKSGELLNGFGLGDLSLVYFLSICLLMILAGYNSLFFLILAFSTILVVGYSLYAQTFILNKWCVLCLIIGGLAVLQSAIIFNLSEFATIPFNFLYFLKAGFVFSLIGLIWFYGKDIISKSIKKDQLEIEYTSFKRKKGLFKLLLTNQPQIKVILPENLTIGYGNTDASLVITAVINPLCIVCSETFKSYDKLLEMYGDRIRINFILEAPSPTEKSPSTAIAQHMIELYQTNKSSAYAFLKNWFENRDLSKTEINSLITKLTEKERSDFDILMNHAMWLDKNGINSTPQTIIGSYFFPKEFDVSDLHYFIEELIECNIPS